MIYIELLLGFLQVGLFAFGGAYGAIPLIRDVVMKYGWLSEESFLYMIALSESTPGPIMVNLATFVGREQGGLWGALIATVSVVLPSFIIILLLMAALKSLLKNKFFKGALKGMKPCITGIVLATAVYMLIEGCGLGGGGGFLLKDGAVTLLLALLMFLLPRLTGKRTSPIALIIISAGLGLLLF